ncbi:MAG: hypothetical protein NXY57DRAFT_1075724, partial [Lentinula lateritia]
MILTATTGLVVSGSTALKFFMHVDYGGDVDTYCHLQQANTVGLWYLAHDFVFEPVVGQLGDFTADFKKTCKLHEEELPEVMIPIDGDIREYKLNNIAAVWNFLRGSLKVQLIATIGSPLTTILSFHSTCVMNVLTHEAAYCLYPNLTLEHRATLLMSLTLPMTEVQAAAIEKYWQRGFEILTDVPTSWSCNPNSAVTFLCPRFIGDKHCYKIPFE